MALGYRQVPNQFEPLRPNRFELIFPNDLVLGSGKYQWIVNMADRPKVKINNVEIPYFNGRQVVAGKASFGSMTIEFLDLQGPSSVQLIMEWHRLCYEALSNRMGYASGYKKDLVLLALDPTLVAVQKFTITGAYITDIDFGKNDHADDAIQKITTTLEYDYAENNY